MNKLDVDKIINSQIAVSPIKGEVLYKSIISSILKKEEVCLDFKNITQLTTAFLNSAIGDLYKVYNSDELNQYLKVEGLDELDKYLFAKVINRSKLTIEENDELQSDLKGDN